MSAGASYTVPTGEFAATSSWQYRVPGLLSWSVLALLLIALLAAPSAMMVLVIVFAHYSVARLTLTFAYSLVGTWRVRQWSRRDWSVDRPLENASADDMQPADIHHLVILPNFKEPASVLTRTLDALAAQERAHDRLTVVLAMEDREVGALAKGEALARQYAGRFANLLVTVHPPGIPGEIACKAANASWAVVKARSVLVDEQGVALDHIVVTTADADSVFHPCYFAALSRLYAGDDKRHHRIWQAPIYYHNNIWRIPAAVRMAAYFAHTAQLGQLTMPFFRELPISTYSLGLRLAASVGYWDPGVISDDWHMFLRCYFATAGNLKTVPIYLPTTADMPDGATYVKALRNRYLQLVRHSWGAEDVGYILRKWPLEHAVPVLKKAAVLSQVAFEHLMRFAAWFMIMGAGALTAVLNARGEVTLLSLDDIPSMPYVWALGLGVVLGVQLIETIRSPRPAMREVPSIIVDSVVAYFLGALFAFVLGSAPAIYSQTRLMLGHQLAFRVTPKRLAGQLGEA